MSRQSEKFLIGQSRKFLLTAAKGCFFVAAVIEQSIGTHLRRRQVVGHVDRGRPESELLRGKQARATADDDAFPSSVSPASCPDSARNLNPQYISAFTFTRAVDPGRQLAPVD